MEESDLALVDAPVELEFDLYDNADAQTISYTTSSTGAVTVSQSDYITATVNANNTITVTPVAVTNGPQTITVNQAADGTYAAGSVTFTVDIEDSTPTTSSDVTFNAATDTGTSPLVKEGVTFACSNGVLNNGSEYRLYKYSVTTFSVSEGNITQIAFTGVSGNPASGFANQTGWTTSGSNGTWSGSATSVSFTASGAQVRATQIVVTVETSGTPAPSISANNVDLDYDAEEGTITYSINNPVEGGSITASTNAQWLMVDDEAQSDPEGSFYFTCGPNSNFYAHSATVTLTYTYGDSKATVTKDVTVTQAKDPDANGSTSEYPITVSEAIEAIDEVGTVSSIYVGGIVSSIVSAYNNSYVTFDMYDATGDEYSLRAYHCEGEDADEVAVGDEVVVYGNLMLYNNSIYELASGCQLVSLTHHVVSAITVDPSTVNATAAETEGTLTVTYTGIQTELDPEIYWFESDGTTEATYNHDWIQTEINADYNVYYVIGANDGAARTAYFKVFGLDEELNDVYSGLVTVSQAAAPQQYTLTVSELDANINAIFVYDNPNGSPLIADGAAGNVSVLEGTEILVSPDVASGYVLASLMVDGEDVISELDESGAYTFTMTGNVTISATAVEAPQPEIYTYVLATSVQSGKHYIITNGSDKAMGGQNTNNRAAIDITTTNDTVTINSDDVYEFIIAIDEDNNNVYTIYDPRDVGYLYAAGGNGNSPKNHLKLQSTLTDNGRWTIEFEDDAANITAIGDADRNIIRYNSTNDLFSCYGSGQDDIYLYERVYTRKINAYENDNNPSGWYLIASPVTSSITPSADNGFITDDISNPNNRTYDLYYFDQTGGNNGKEWKNYRVNNFNLVNGTGYLYANKNGTTLAFTGVPYSGDGEVDLVYSDDNDDADMWGWNLIGNPFSTAATVDKASFRVSGGNDFIAAASGSRVEPMEGLFVYTAEDAVATFTQTRASRSTGNSENLILNLSRGSNELIDRAIVSFSESNVLPKFQLNPNNTKLYITQDNKDYAVVRTEAQGEMPVNFKAAENGTYTLTVNPEGVEMNYLHLIDNMTGADIDLLQTPSYTFSAATRDYESRFRLVFAASNSANADSEADNFAFFSNGSWIINNVGEATLQVVDVNGRILSTETVNGSVGTTINAASGVYMLRLINGENVKVQKIVVR